MERQTEQKVAGGSLLFEIHGKEAWITEARVQQSHFEIPALLQDCPVTVIGKKAVLGSKGLCELVLPDTLEEVGDWAFAHCTRLFRVELPRKNIRLGKGVFKDCRLLTEIALQGENKETARLLGAVPVKLKAEYLLNPKEAGGEVWLSMYDARLMTLLQREDREGYSKQVLCGEEDLMANLEEYMAETRREKAALCYLRLINDTGLTREMQERLQNFLRENTKGCAYEASWEELRREHGGDREYYRIFTEAGCVTEENFEGLLRDMGEENPEMKAYLMRYREESRPPQDFFDSLSLDF